LYIFSSQFASLVHFSNQQKAFSMMLEEDEEKPRVWLILLLALAAAVGITLDILACVFWGGWWLILVVVVFAFLPLPAFLCKRYGDPFSDSSYGNDIAHFWTGLLASSGLALPLMLLHAGIVRTTGVITGLIGGAVVGASVAAYLFFFHRKSAEDF